jgi:hypothetical protein
VLAYSVVVLIYSLLCSNSTVNSAMNFTSKFGTQVLPVAILDVDVDKRMKYQIKWHGYHTSNSG